MSGPRVMVMDYGMGNILSVCRAFEYCEAEVKATRDKQKIKDADRLVLPGVGAFGDCMNALKDAGLVETLFDFINTGRPMMGICVGMQALFEGSEEFGKHEGLGIIAGWVKAIPSERTDGALQKVPHVGWSQLECPEGRDWSNSVLNGLAPGVSTYFVHSYTGHPECDADRLAEATYGGHTISAAVARDNVIGTQFHPEKSGPVGLKLIDNFVRM